MFSLSVPTVVSKLSTAAASKLEMFADNSLAKSATQAANNKVELRIWAEEQEDKLEAKITKHLQRKRSSEAELVAIQAWRKEANTEETK